MNNFTIQGSTYEDIRPHKTDQGVEYQAVHSDKIRCSWIGRRGLSLVLALFVVPLAFESVRNTLFHGTRVKKTYKDLDLSQKEVADEIHRYAMAKLGQLPYVAAVDLTTQLNNILRDCELIEVGRWEGEDIDLENSINELDTLLQSASLQWDKIYDGNDGIKRWDINELMNRAKDYKIKFSSPTFSPYHETDHLSKEDKIHYICRLDIDKMDEAKRVILREPDKAAQKELLNAYATVLGKRCNPFNYLGARIIRDWSPWKNRHFPPTVDLKEKTKVSS
jgi:hypothetical protein